MAKETCIECGAEELHRGAFCSGRCRHIYRSGEEPNSCNECGRSGNNVNGFCSRRCQRRHTRKSRGLL